MGNDRRNVEKRTGKKIYLIFTLIAFAAYVANFIKFGVVLIGFTIDIMWVFLNWMNLFMLKEKEKDTNEDIHNRD